MEAARVLADCPTEATLIFIAFDSEETGQEGSRAYVADHHNDRILAMLNVDMIGHTAPANPSIYVLSTQANPMQEDVAKAVRLYGNGVQPVVQVIPELGDHISFEPFTNACALWRTADNPNYHQASDAVETDGNIDYTYATSITRAIVGYLATQAVIVQRVRARRKYPGRP